MGSKYQKICRCCKWITVKRNRKRLCRILLVPVVVFLLMWAINLELYVAREKVSYLNNACELTESQLDHLRTAVIAYATVLEEFNQTYWLDFGTLLGVHRCNDVLPHDGDADISRIAAGTSRSQDKYISNLMAARLEKAIGAVLTPFTLSYKNITVDIFTWQKEDDIVKNFYQVHGDQPHFPQDLIFPLKKTIFAGYPVSVPNKMTEILQLRYPFSGPSKMVSYKWRCYFRTISTLGFRPPRCPTPISDLSIISQALQNISNSVPNSS